MEDTSGVIVRFRVTPWMLLCGYWALGIRVISVLATVLALVTAFAVISSVGKPDFGSAVAMYVLGWALFAVGFGVLPWSRFRALAKEPNFAGECELTADEESLRARNGQMESRFEWSSFTRLVELRGLLILRMGKKHMVVLPKAAFVTGDDLAGFRDLVSRKIAK